jgi:rfaE bifunctional protein nucleotidyltransferase chain/domain
MDRRLYTAIFADSLREGIALRRRTREACAEAVILAAKTLKSALDGGHKVLFAGNGGSAADAQHLAAELVGRFVKERRPLPGIALTVDTSALTAIANDYGFDQVFARQVLGLGQPGDVLVAITTSGTSPNVLRALEAARERKMACIGLTSTRAPESFYRACDVTIAIPSKNTARTQELHITIGHVLCELLEVDGDEPIEATPLLSKETTIEALLPLRAHWRAEKTTVAWTSGCFDVLHAGHVKSLTAARAFGDVLVVGINSDESVRALKGAGRPIFSARERSAMLAALEVVDHVVVFDGANPSAALDHLRPDVHCKGADYAGPNAPPMPEAEVVRAYGGRIEFLPLIPELSTSSVLKRL